ncbi:hypothetical protein [Sulfurimonas sp.]
MLQTKDLIIHSHTLRHSFQFEKPKIAKPKQQWNKNRRKPHYLRAPGGDGGGGERGKDILKLLGEKEEKQIDGWGKDGKMWVVVFR